MQAAALIQTRVVGALVLREARTRFGKAQMGYLWALVEPIALVVTFTLASMALGHLPPYGDSLPMFFALGTLGYQFYRRVASYCSAAFDANQALLTYPVVQQVDTLIARALLEIASCALVTVLMLGTIVFFAGQQYPAQLDALVAGMALLALLGFGHGALNAVIANYFTSWRAVESMLSRPIFMVSGIFFVPDRMPPKFVEVLAWNPILHGVELIRYGYYSGYRSQSLDVTYLFFWALGLTVLGLAAERVMRVRSVRGEAGAV